MLVHTTEQQQLEKAVAKMESRMEVRVKEFVNNVMTRGSREDNPRIALHEKSGSLLGMEIDIKR